MNLKHFNTGIFLLLFLSAVAVAQPSVLAGQTNKVVHPDPPSQIAGGKVVTRAGVVYQGVLVEKIAPDGLIVSYRLPEGGTGIAKLKFKDLSGALQQQYGYSSTNAAAFEKEQRQAEGQWRAKLIAEDEKGKAKRQEQAIKDAEGYAKWVGTGFFITDNGYLLTCFHVVTNATSIQIGTKQGLFNAELVKYDSDKDVALLKVNGTFYSLPLISSNSVNFGEAVFTIGFPDPEVQGWQPKLTRGEISGLSGFQDDTNEYQVSVPTQPGNSGGALMDEQGNVVGIVAAILRASEADLKNRIAPQNVNYAIKSSDVRAFLGSVPSGWPLKLRPEYPSADRKFEDVVRSSQDAVAIVLVQ